MGYQENFAFWQQRLAGSQWQPELTALAADPEAMENAFYRYLEFGTAGMRGELGLGSNKMNIFTVRRSTQGLADHLNRLGRGEQGVVIAYDSRRNSALFARETALTLAANGVRAYLYDKLTSVPQLSFSVLQLGAAAGVVITASHNPAKYNGYKVYGPDGGQLADADAAAVMERINAIDDPFAIRPLDEAAARAAGLLIDLGAELDQRYWQQVLSLVPDDRELRAQASRLRVVYTPLHGAGLLSVSTVLRRLGVEQLFIVPEQERPDGDFPTLDAPNPENPQAFELGQALADQVGADLILATDPDCDRLGVAVRGRDGKFFLLTGNQIGVLLLDYVLSQSELRGGEFVVRSLVSTALADRVAAAYGVELREVLTGFKYIAQQIKNSVEAGSGRFLFGFEESYGFLAGDFVRDKDACIAALLVVCAACRCAGRGHSLADALEQLYASHGWFKESVISITREGVSGLRSIQAAMAALRAQPPAELAGQAILACRDYLAGCRVDSAGCRQPLTLPPADVLVYELAGGSFILRPSGTEPKLKAYLAVHADSAAQAGQRSQALEAAVRQLLEQLL